MNQAPLSQSGEYLERHQVKIAIVVIFPLECHPVDSNRGIKRELLLPFVLELQLVHQCLPIVQPYRVIVNPVLEIEQQVLY